MNFFKLKRKIERAKRSIRFFWQRQARGWDDSETFSLDYSLAQLIAPRLKRFKQIKQKSCVVTEQWVADIDKMIAAFEFLGSEERWMSSDKKKFDEVQEGLELFAEHYMNLWW